MNCLSYTLRFWNSNRNYIILCNSDHCINVPNGTVVEGFLPLFDFGYVYFVSWYIQRLITKEDLYILRNYFNQTS